MLTEAFHNGEDIHTRTAAEVFNVDPLMMTPDMRRSAKTVNFGIVYGQTPFGLAQQLAIDRKEAEMYIDRYFERYAGVWEFMDTPSRKSARRALRRLCSAAAGRFRTCRAGIPPPALLLSAQPSIRRCKVLPPISSNWP